MTITFDAKSTGIQGYGGGITQNHTVGAGANRILLAFLCIRGAGAGTDYLNGVKYGALNMTLVQSNVSSGACSYVFMLLNPPSGTDVITTSYNTASTAGITEAVSFAGVDQTAPIFNSNKSTTNFSAATETLSVTNTTGGVAVDGIAFIDSPATLTADPSQTEIDNWGNGGGKLQGTAELATSYKLNGTAMSWSTSTNLPTSHVAVALNPDAATGTPPAADTTAPTMNGVIAASNITASSFTVSYPAATDNTGVTGYELSTDNGATYVNIGNVLSTSVTNRTASTTYNVKVRGYDAAGNKALPLSAAISTTAAGTPTPPTTTTATITLPYPFNSVVNGATRANEAGVRVSIFDFTTDALLSQKTGLATDANGNIAAFAATGTAAGTQYRCLIVFADGADAMEWVTAS